MPPHDFCYPGLSNKLPAWKESRKRAPSMLNFIFSVSPAHTMARSAALLEYHANRQKLDNRVIMDIVTENIKTY